MKLASAVCLALCTGLASATGGTAVLAQTSAAVDPQIGCTFTNGGRAVEEARVVVPTAGAGQRLGLPVYGPRTDVFVDRVLCRVLTP
jgi:hypothetical protein